MQRLQEQLRISKKGRFIVQECLSSTNFLLSAGASIDMVESRGKAHPGSQE